MWIQVLSVFVDILMDMDTNMDTDMDTDMELCICGYGIVDCGWKCRRGMGYTVG